MSLFKQVESRHQKDGLIVGEIKIDRNLTDKIIDLAKWAVYEKEMTKDEPED